MMGRKGKKRRLAIGKVPCAHGYGKTQHVYWRAEDSLIKEKVVRNWCHSIKPPFERNFGKRKKGGKCVLRFEFSQGK